MPKAPCETNDFGWLEQAVPRDDWSATCNAAEVIAMADGDATIRLDQGGINARILAKEAKADFRRVEAASRKIQTTLCSPEVKRQFVRHFNRMQLNMYLISVIARTKLPHAVIEEIEAALKAQLEKLHAEINEAIDSAEALCKVHGITRLATYDTEPLAIEAKVISSFGRRYLELMARVDQLMPMLETLAIDEVIEVAQLDLQKALAKKSVRQVAGAARNFAAGLRQRMNAAAAEDATQSDSAKDQRSEAGAGSPKAQADAPAANESEVTSVTVGAATDSPVDSAATTQPPRPKHKGRALTSTDSASQASAPV
jgi:ribosomal protein L10